MVDMQTWCRTRADFAGFVQTLYRLGAHFFIKVCVLQTMQTLQKSACLQKSIMQSLCTLSPLGVKVCVKSPNCSSNPHRNLANTQNAHRLRPGRAPALPPPPPPCWPWGCCRDAWLLVFLALVLTAVFMHFEPLFYLITRSILWLLCLLFYYMLIIDIQNYYNWYTNFLFW
jgi:hypothetical protein